MDRFAEIETSTSYIVYDNDGILSVTSKPDIDLDLFHAKRDFDEARQLVNNAQVLVLVDSRKQLSHTKEVREFYGSKEMAQHIKAMALLVDSIATRLTANFFIRFNDPFFPTKVFTSETEARQWLIKIGKGDT